VRLHLLYPQQLQQQIFHSTLFRITQDWENCDFLIPRRTSTETTIEPPLCVVVKSLALNHHAIVQLPVEVGCHTLRMPLSLRFMGKPTVEGICRLLLRTLLYPGQYVVSKIYKYYIKHLKKVLIV